MDAKDWALVLCLRAGALVLLGWLVGGWLREQEQHLNRGVRAVESELTLLWQAQALPKQRPPLRMTPKPKDPT